MRVGEQWAANVAALSFALVSACAADERRDSGTVPSIGSGVDSQTSSAQSDADGSSAAEGEAETHDAPRLDVHAGETTGMDPDGGDAGCAHARRRADGIAARANVLLTLLWLLVEDASRPVRWWVRRARLGRVGVRGRTRRDLVKRVGRKILIERGRVTAPQAQRLLKSWKWVHVPFTIILTAIATFHIYESWGRAW